MKVSIIGVSCQGSREPVLHEWNPPNTIGSGGMVLRSFESKCGLSIALAVDQDDPESYRKCKKCFGALNKESQK